MCRSSSFQPSSASSAACVRWAWGAVAVAVAREGTRKPLGCACCAAAERERREGRKGGAPREATARHSHLRPPEWHAVGAQGQGARASQRPQGPLAVRGRTPKRARALTTQKETNYARSCGVIGSLGYFLTFGPLSPISPPGNPPSPPLWPICDLAGPRRWGGGYVHAEAP